MNTTIDNSWPPATLHKTADELVHLYRVSCDFANHITQILPEVCSNEGHVWDNPTGVKTIEEEGGMWVEGTEKIGSVSGFVGSTTVVYFVRTCTRCKTKQKLKAKLTETSPFHK